MTGIVTPPAKPTVPIYPALGSPTFNQDAYAYGSGMPGVVDGIDALASNTHNNALATEERAVIADAAAVAAVDAKVMAEAAAASAINAPGANATSTTSNSVGAGVKNFTLTQLGKLLYPGQRAVAARTSDPTGVRMVGLIGANDPATGAFSMTVGAGDFIGSGSYTDWTISLAGEGTNLPVLTGPDVGKVLGVVAGPAYGLVAARGAGAATPSGSTTLTAASAGVQRITTTAPGQWVKLPDATTMTTGVGVFSLSNRGAWDLEIQGNDGVALGFIPPGATVGADLSSIATAAGVWELHGAAPMGVLPADVAFALSLGATSSGQVRTVVELDATRDLLIFAGNARAYAVVWDNAANQFGTPVLVRVADIQARVQAVKSATDQVLCVSLDGSTGLEAVTLSVTGTAVVPNAVATATLASAATLDQLVPIAGQGFVLGYYKATGTTTGLRALTVTGTTVAIGAEVATAGSAANSAIFDAGSGRAMVFAADTTSVYCRPYAMSGTALALGTPTAVATGASNNYAVRALAFGRWGVVHKAASTFVGGAVVSLAGTVASATTVALGSTAVDNASWLGVVYAIGSQLIVASRTTANLATINVLTDNAGAAVAGTELLQGAATAGVVGLAYGANTVTAHIGDSSTAASGRAVQIGISGNNPVLLAARHNSARPLAEGGLSAPGSAVVSGKDTFAAGIIQGQRGSLSGLSNPNTTLWHTAGGLPNIISVQPLITSLNTNKLRSVAGNYEWASAVVTAGTLLCVQRVKVA